MINSRTALYQPERLPPFLGIQRPRGAIDPRQPIHAAWLAGLAHSAYHPDQRLPHLLDHQGCTCTTIVERRGIRAYLAGDADQRYLVFCGTRPQEHRNILTDGDARWRSLPEGGRCHRGFLAGLDQVWDQLAQAIQPTDPRPLLLIGHSLGAALATLASLRCQAAQIIGFGVPRIGDAACQAALQTPCIRYQNACDIVGHLPPADLGWRHAGRCAFIDRRQILIDPAPAVMRRLQLLATIRYAAAMPWARRNTVLVPHLAHHNIVAYQYRLAAVG